MIKTVLYALFALLLSAPLIAQQTPTQSNSVLNSLLQGQESQAQFLPVAQAFALDHRQKDGELLLSFTIADGYYMYRDKFKFGGIAVSFSHPSYPASIAIEDEFFGKTEVYYHQLQLKIPLADIDEDAIFRVQFMGCAEAGFCYPPTTVELPLQQNTLQTSEETPAAPVSSQYELTTRLSEGSLLTTLGIFFVLGLGLAFTPCVFPMYPILSSIIVGQGKALSGRRAFSLSMSYVQGMALAYSILGLVVASLGMKFQAALQHPAVLIGVSILFVFLALSMFGAFTLQLPARWQEKINGLSNKQQGGSLRGAFIMGTLSGLIASPCTTAPLSAALLYVAQSGDLVIGALTLYILSLGMGLPLLLLGTSGGKLLPKAGHWMNAVKVIFGFLLLAVPLVLLERFLPFSQILMLGTLLTLALAVYLLRLAFSLQNITAKAVLTLLTQLILFGMFWLNLAYWQSPAITTSNAVTANSTSIIQTPTEQQTNQLGFIEIKTAEELAQQLQLAAAANQYTMVDLYADWCVACKEFEKLTFPAPEVTALTSQMRLLKIDVTRMTRQDQALLDSYQVLGLPTLLFFAPGGTELTTSRITGFKNSSDFAAHLQALIQ